MDASATFTADVAGLVYVADGAHGIRRVRRGQRFEYVTERGKRITSETVLERIRKLAIPPAYESVWICRNPRGHLQATGRDARGRKQYRYHALWRTARDGLKFGRMAAFGTALPALRRRLRRDLEEPALSRVKVVAAVVSLLDATLVRIGNDEYARSNHSYGLSTLRDRHVRFIRGGQVRLLFRGKGGVPHEIDIDNARLARIVRRCHQLPGQRLFQFVDADGSQHPVDSDQVNAYLREVTGADFTAKDFRTWGATTRAIELLARTPLPDAPSERAYQDCELAVVRAVARELRNTPAVCRRSYINPVVFAAWRSGRLHEVICAKTRGAGRIGERCTLALLRRAPRRSRQRSAGRAG